MHVIDGQLPVYSASEALLVEKVGTYSHVDRIIPTGSSLLFHLHQYLVLSLPITGAITIKKPPWPANVVIGKRSVNYMIRCVS